MKNRYDIDDYYQSVKTSLETIEKDATYPSYFYQSLYDGNSKFFLREQIESRKFDELWIRTIESYFPSINRITINLKSTLKYQSEIIPIEKTKKINKESVIHLMSHSNFIREINEDGVVPKQILSILPEIEYGIYENRFIMTLINRLRDFVNKRVKIMRQKIKASKIIHMNLNSDFNFEESDFKMTVDIKQTQDINQRKIDEHNISILERAEKLLRLINRLKNTQFMKVLQRFKPVKSPIMKTQIILSNSDFKNAYLLWLYLDYYNELGYNLNVKSVNKRFTKAYTKEINQSLMMICTTLLSNDKSAKNDNTTKYKAEFKEKPAKTIKKLPIEVEIEPIVYEIEDVGINEYYLAKNKQILKKQFENLIKKGSSYKVALKKALSDSLNITASLYESFFEVNADDDVFQLLIKDEDPQKEYQDAYDKYLICSTLREVRERDFKKSLSLERRWQEELKKCNKKLLESKEEELNKNNDNIIEEIKNKYQDKLDIISAREYREKQSLMRKHRAESVVFRKKLKQEYREKIKELKVKSNKKSKEEKQRVIEQAKINIQKAQQKYKQELQTIKNEHEERLKLIDKQFKEKLINEKKAMQEKANEKLLKQNEREKVQTSKSEELTSQKKEKAPIIEEKVEKKTLTNKIPEVKEDVKNINVDSYEPIAEAKEEKETSTLNPDNINEKRIPSSINLERIANNKDSSIVKEVLSDLYKLFSEGKRKSSESDTSNIDQTKNSDKAYPDRDKIVRSMKDVGLDDKQLWLENNKIKQRLSDCIPSKYKFINNIVIILYKESRINVVLNNEKQVDEIIIRKISKKLNDAYGIGETATTYVLELICQLLNIEIIEI